MDSLDYITASGSAMENENQSDNSSSGSSLFKTQCVPSSPKWRQRNPVKKCVSSLQSVQARDSSSDSSLEPRPLTLKAIFERFKKKKRKKRKYKPTGRPRGRPEGRKSTRSQINKKQFKDNRPQFPFLESENGRKPLPWRKILTFEQAVARGFFNYLEKLKYEYHLKESLKQMNVGEDLEKDDLDSRRYKYLDDDGSLSPIEDPVGEDEVETNLEHDECDIKLVGFMLKTQFLDLKVYPDGAFSVDLHRWKRLIEFLCISKICTILGSDNLGLIGYEPTHVYRCLRLRNQADPSTLTLTGPKVNCLRKLGPNNYRWGVFEICPYASGDQRSTKRIMELRCKLTRRNQGLRTCEIPLIKIY